MNWPNISQKAAVRFLRAYGLILLLAKSVYRSRYRQGVGQYGSLMIIAEPPENNTPSILPARVVLSKIVSINGILENSPLKISLCLD